MALKHNKRFLYLQVYETIKKNIENNIWPAGSQIPTEYELMEEFNVSRDTIRKSLSMLLQKGYIYRQAGKGTFVRQNKSYYKLTKLEGFTEQMKSRGLKPSSEVVDISCITPSDYIKSCLELDDNEKVYEIKRLRKANSEPMSYEIAYVSKKLCPDIDKKIDNNTSLYRLYEEEFNLEMDYGDVNLEAEIASEEISKMLNLNYPSAVLKMECLVYLKNKKPLYLVYAYYVGEKYVFSASMPRNL